jgi:hypothetical protein
MLVFVVALVLSQPGEVAAEAGQPMPPVKVVRAYLQAYRTYKPAALKPLLADGVASPLTLDPFWFSLPPFKKAWAAQTLKPGKPSPSTAGVGFQVEAELLDTGGLAPLADKLTLAVKDLPAVEGQKKRKELALAELKEITWSYRAQTIEVLIVKTSAGFKIGAPGFAKVEAAATPPPIEPPVFVVEPHVVEESGPPPAADGYKAPSKKAIGAYPAALRVIEVEGAALDSAFTGKVVAIVKNDGPLAIVRFRANVFYMVGSGETSDSRRSFVLPAEVLCPGATGQLEGEALPPPDRLGFSGRLRIEIVDVEFDRPDAFGRLKSLSCRGGADKP